VEWIPSLIVSDDARYKVILALTLTPLAAVRNRLWNNAGFFLVFWAVHYLPFFLFSRQLFIHHYLPSHLSSALIAGAVLNFILSETINYPISVSGPKTRLRPSQYSDIGVKGLVFLGLFSFLMFFMFVFLAPLTYGTPGYVLTTCTKNSITNQSLTA
jgi:dolichyl-phosphate-mannose-protein mannosyltransferase